jgi:hypothetical protein
MQLQIFTLTLLVALASAASAQESPKQSAPTTEKIPTKEQRDASDDSLKPLVRFDADLNGDGIFDAVQSLESIKHARINDLKSSTNSKLQNDLTVGFAKAQSGSPPQHRNTCMDYLLLPLEEKEKIDERIQQRTGGAFGSRPCDPYVSDMVERPFESEHVEISIIPVHGLHGVANHTMDTHLIQIRTEDSLK